MTPAERAECMAIYAAGDATMAELAKKYGVSPATINALARREGVKKGQHKAQREEIVREVVKQQAITEAEKLLERKTDTNEEHYKMASGIAKLIWNEIAEAKKNNKPLATAYHNINALKRAAEGLKVLREERYVILGIKDDENNDDTPPELVVKELTAKDIKEMQRKAALAADDDLGVPDIELGDDELLDDDGSLDDAVVIEGEE